LKDLRAQDPNPAKRQTRAKRAVIDLRISVGGGIRCVLVGLTSAQFGASRLALSQPLAKLKVSTNFLPDRLPRESPVDTSLYRM